MASGIPPEESERLKVILEDLREALENAEAADGPTRERLADLAAQTRGLLESDESPTVEAHATYGSRLAEELAHFEGSHPDLALAIGRVIETLSGLGI
jgi:hypothetical protein